MVNRLFGTWWINCESHMCSSVAVGHDSDLVLTSFWTSFFHQLTSHKLCGKWLFSFNCTVWLDCSCCRCGSCCWFLLASDGFCLLLLASACSCCFLPTAAVFCSWLFRACGGRSSMQKRRWEQSWWDFEFRCSSGYNANRIQLCTVCLKGNFNWTIPLRFDLLSSSPHSVEWASAIGKSHVRGQ